MANGRMTGSDPKADLRRYLQEGREALLWKHDGLSEYDIRRPLVPTGTNLLGLIKHQAGAELAYFWRHVRAPLPPGPTAVGRSRPDVRHVGHSRRITRVPHRSVSPRLGTFGCHDRRARAGRHRPRAVVATRPERGDAASHLGPHRHRYRPPRRDIPVPDLCPQPPVARFAPPCDHAPT